MKRILTTRQVKEALNVHINTVYKYIHCGVLKAFKLGGANSVKHWRIREEDLEAFLRGAELEHERHIEKESDSSEQLAGSAPASK